MYGRGRDREQRGGLEAALDPVELEAGGADRGLGVARCLAAAERPRPEERVDRVLHGAERRAGRADVLVHAQLAAGYKHPAELAQRRGHVRHAAQDPDAHDGVETPGVRRQALGEAFDDVDRCGGSGSALGGRHTGHRIGFHGQHSLHPGRVVLEGGAVSAPDLHHPTPDPRQELAAKRPRRLVRPPLLAALEEAREPRLPRPVERRLGHHSSSAGRPSIERTLCAAL